MAWSTSVVAPPDGVDGRLHGLAGQSRARAASASTGPATAARCVEPQRYVRALAHHRRQREAAILAALDDGVATVPDLVARVYAGLDPKLARAAGLSTLAHLEDLIARGRAAAEPAEDGEPRFRRV